VNESNTSEVAAIIRSMLTGSFQCVVFPGSLAPFATVRRALLPLRSPKVEFGTQLSGESKGTFGRGSWPAHREGGVPIWLLVWSRRQSDRDILDIVPFGMPSKFTHYQSFQFGGASLFLHAFLCFFVHREWFRQIGRTTKAGPDA
jgi:hypothetical protein